MSKNIRPKLAALLGVASLTVATAGASAGPSPVAAEQVTRADERNSLRDLIDRRLERASAQGRHEEIEQLGTLWMTLAQREQLDRVVDRGEGFLNVALRNQRVSELRSEARARRVALLDATDLEAVARTRENLDESIDVERFVNGLEAPYREAVQLSLAGLNHREVAEELGVSHAAARKWAQRLRDRLPDDIFS
ncbi:MAG TPA: sigma factor-like helix-turn-helix DNA-binding protein [Polyangiaceae bacterium]|jgi:hypothetical protein|nr:sigma factor-like helix-turn-helix DNA-binding protein [Polyangiaceae bacterium]